MRIKQIHLSYLLMFWMLLSCSFGYKTFNLKGVVVNANTHQPIDSVSMYILRFNQLNIDQSTISSRVLNLEQNGEYNHIEKRIYGFQLQFETHGYYQKIIPLKTESHKIIDSIQLQPIRFFDNQNIYLSKENYVTNSVYIGLREFLSRQKDNNSQNLIIGFDFLTGKTTTNLSEADIWLKSKIGSTQIITIMANPNGGLIATYSNNKLDSSHLLKYTEAPTDGYIRKIELQGDEDQILIKCRDGIHFARITPLQSPYEVTLSSSSTAYRDTRYPFSYQLNKSPSYRFFNPIYE